MPGSTGKVRTNSSFRFSFRLVYKVRPVLADQQELTSTTTLRTENTDDSDGF